MLHFLEWGRNAQWVLAAQIAVKQSLRQKAKVFRLVQAKAFYFRNGLALAGVKRALQCAPIHRRFYKVKTRRFVTVRNGHAFAGQSAFL